MSMRRGGWATAAGALVLSWSLMLGACAPTDGAPDPGDSWAPAPESIDGLDALAAVDGTRLALFTADGPRDFLPGVNLGATVPGTAPGQVAISREDIRRWLPMMAQMGLRVVRIYTILPPHFYEELAAYNEANPANPVYLMHGVWIPEERFMATRDLYDAEVREGFRTELTRAVDVVHGHARIEARPGHAHGDYTADVTPWLMGWAIGIEWDPQATLASDETNAGQQPFAGDYFLAADGASPTESWLAEMMDHLAAELAARGLTMPLTFNNWPTTDPLEHPEEPLEIEDLVGVDANHVLPTAAWPGGTFASYHAYPYYPDFQRYEPGIADFEHRGRIDPYAGYLTRLREHHDVMPLMITEFGVPSSLGSAHAGPLGRDQGGHDEHTQMAINADLLQVIADLELAGGLVFAWQDEWFKRTWNTLPLELPEERRPLWNNVWTNEQHFGLLDHAAGAELRVLVGGDEDTWLADSQVIHESWDGIREVRATHDEAYLYLRIVLDDARRSDEVTIDLSLWPTDDAMTSTGREPGATHAVTLPPDGGPAQAWVRAGQDPHAWINGADLGMLDVDGQTLRGDPRTWRPQRLMLNRPYPHPLTGTMLPAEEQEVGVLRSGTTDPDDPAFDSLAMWAEADGIITTRLPWATVGFADPSSRLGLHVAADGTVGTEPVERLGVTVSVGDTAVRTRGYAWEPWQLPTWHERPKAGLDEFVAVVRDLTP